MFCNKCGQELSEDSKFCGKCGNFTLKSETTSTIDSSDNMPCPKCKSTNCQMIAINDTETEDGEKVEWGFSWMCPDCGNKFLPPLTPETQKGIAIGSLIGRLIVFTVLGIICAGTGILFSFSIILSVIKGDFSGIGLAILLALLLTPVGIVLIYCAIQSVKAYAEQRKQINANHHE